MTELFEFIVRYLRVIHPFRMIWHVILLFFVLCMLSMSYIITFHFQPAMDLWIKSRGVAHFTQELKISVKVDAEINGELNRLLSSSKGGRAYIFRYHNGTPSANNVPFIFTTNTHEVISAGVNRVIRFGDRLPSSLIQRENIDFMEHKCAILSNINADVNSASYWLYETRGAIALVRCPFYTSNGDLVGFVGVDFVQPILKDQLLKVQTEVEKSATSLGFIYDQN